METKAKQKNVAARPVAAPSVDSEALKRIVVLKSKHGVDISDYYRSMANSSAMTAGNAHAALMFDVR
jgi:hypothetical protein